MASTLAPLATFLVLVLNIASGAIGMDCANLGITMSNESSAIPPPSSQNDVNQATAKDLSNHGRKLKEEYGVSDEKLPMPASKYPANYNRKLKEESGATVMDGQLLVPAAKDPANDSRNLKEEYGATASDVQRHASVPPIGFHGSSTYIPKLVEPHTSWLTT